MATTFSVVPNTTYTTDSNGKFTYTIPSDASTWRNNNGKFGIAFPTGIADCSVGLGTYNSSNYTFTFTLYAIDNRTVVRTFYAFLVLFQQYPYTA